MKDKEIFRVTGRKDIYGEVADWICNECRFDKKDAGDWTIEGPSNISRHSVISQNHYTLKVPPHKPLLNSVNVVPSGPQLNSLNSNSDK